MKSEVPKVNNIKSNIFFLIGKDKVKLVVNEHKSKYVWKMRVRSNWLSINIFGKREVSEHKSKYVWIVRGNVKLVLNK